MKTKTANKILLDAADILEQRGWVRRKFIEENKLCALGAINTATCGRPMSIIIGEYTERDKAVMLLATEISYSGNQARNDPSNVMDAEFRIMTWNDEIAKNKEAVVRKLRKVAKENADK